MPSNQLQRRHWRGTLPIELGRKAPTALGETRTEQARSIGRSGRSLLSIQLPVCVCGVCSRKQLFSMLYIPLPPDLLWCMAGKGTTTANTEHLPPVLSLWDCKIHLKQMAISTPGRTSCNFTMSKEMGGLPPKPHSSGRLCGPEAPASHWKAQMGGPVALSELLGKPKGNSSAPQAHTSSHAPPVIMTAYCSEDKPYL